MDRDFHFWRLLATVVVIGAALMTVASPAIAGQTDAESTEQLQRPDQSSGSEQAGSDQQNWLDAEPADAPSVTLGDLESGLEAANEQLQDNFEGFLHRQPLGFDQQLVELIGDDIEAVYQSAVHLIENPQLIEPAAIVGVTLPLVALALFLVLFFLLDRYATHLAHRIQARTHLDLAPWVTTTIRKLILVLGRSSAFVALILLSFFPLRAIFPEANWPLLLTDALYLFLAYRVIKTILMTGLRLHPHSPEAMDHFRRLERFGMVVLRVVLVFLLILAAIARFDYHDQLTAFVTFGFRVTLAILPLYLFRTREAVLDLLPPRPSSRLYQAFHAALARNYYAVLAVTVVLLAFNAAGYTNAATYLLTRGYALIVIGALWFAAIERLHHHVVERARRAEEGDEPASPLLEAFEQWLIAIGSLVIVVVSLRLIGLYEPLTALLNTPLVSIGHLQISAMNLVAIVFIIGGAYLSLRLLKAVLNAKIYPAFGVDIGVAYALNTLINYALVVIAFILCLVALGVQLSAVMVVAASLGVGIGFGLQNIAENLVSGFILLFGRAVQKGDFITVNDLYGRVEAVGARSVVVRTPDNFSMLVPSKEIVSGRIVNWTFQDSVVRIHIPVGVAYDSDPTQVREVLMQTARDHPDILDEPEPDVWIVDFGDSSIQFELLVYFDCRHTNERALKGKFNFLIWEAFQNEEIEIPFPQRDLHLHTVGDDDEG